MGGWGYFRARARVRVRAGAALPLDGGLVLSR